MPAPFGFYGDWIITNETCTDTGLTYSGWHSIDLLARLWLGRPEEVSHGRAGAEDSLDPGHSRSQRRGDARRPTAQWPNDLRVPLARDDQ